MFVIIEAGLKLKKKRKVFLSSAFSYKESSNRLQKVPGFDFDTHSLMEHSKLKKVHFISTAFYCLHSSWYWQKANSVAAAENTVLYK